MENKLTHITLQTAKYELPNLCFLSSPGKVLHPLLLPRCISASWRAPHPHHPPGWSWPLWPLCNALCLLKAAHCYSTRLISTWTNILYISLGYVGAGHGENWAAGWMRALSAGTHILCVSYSHTHIHTPFAQYHTASFLVLSWKLCCSWTKHLSVLGLTLKHHIIPIFPYFSSPSFTGRVEKLNVPTLLWMDDLWPLSQSGWPVNVSFKCAVPRNVPLKWEIPSSLSFMGNPSEGSTRFLKWFWSQVTVSPLRWEGLLRQLC